MPHLEVLSSPTWTTDLTAEWDELFANSESATPFQSRAWLSAWWQVFGRRRRPWIIRVYEGDQLIGLYPLFRGGSAWRALRPVGIGASDYLHPLMRTGHETEVMNAISEHLVAAPSTDLVDLHQIRETMNFELPDAVVSESANCLVLDLPDEYDQYLATLSKSLRFDCRRLDKKPFSTGEAIVELVPENEVEQGMKDLFDLHSSRWKKRGLPGAFALGKIREFQVLAATQLARDGHLRLHRLVSAGKTAGVVYAMHAGRVTYFYQSGFDPDAKALSPGTLLVAAAIRHAIEEGDRQFDFLRGDEPYKRRWKPQRDYRNLRYMVALTSVRGRLGKSFNDASRKVEGKIRARLEGKSLFS